MYVLIIKHIKVLLLSIYFFSYVWWLALLSLQKREKCKKEGSGLLVLLCLLAYVRAHVLRWCTYSHSSCMLVSSCGRLYLRSPEDRMLLH